MSVDVLASERGPSCSKISQLPNLKLIHVRFVVNTDRSESSAVTDLLSHSTASTSGLFPLSVKSSKPSNASSACNSQLVNPLTPPISVPCSTSRFHSVKRRATSPAGKISKFPKSLPVTAMLKLGKPIIATESLNETIEISTFNIDEMVWSAPVSVDFAIEKEEFGRGGFRLARKATSNSPRFEGRTYIVKYFLPGTVEVISQLGETEIDHARKSVQMHALAKHFAAQVSAKVQKDGNSELFGKTFRYVDVFLETCKETNEVVTVEEYAEGEYVKYVNNDGTICIAKAHAEQKKAESLVHFSYVKSNKRLLLVDIQGANYNLTDPEIATVAGVYDDEQHFLFGAGNYSQKACTNFFHAHQCSIFCDLLGLVPESVPIKDSL